MKLSKHQLKQLIKEELQNALQEQFPGAVQRGASGSAAWQAEHDAQARAEVLATRQRAHEKRARKANLKEYYTLSDIFAELQDIKMLLSREMTAGSLGIEGAPQ
jgi:hypothetical protein